MSYYECTLCIVLNIVRARCFAERGFTCLLQDTRGRFGSGGDFFPVKNEIVDGASTIDWVREQPWCNGNVYLFGVSYLGLTAYAAAGSSSGHHVKGVVQVVSCAKSHSILYHDSGALALDLMLRWLWVAMTLMDSVKVVKLWFPSMQKDLDEALHATPLKDQDVALFGKQFDFYQDAIHAHEDHHEFWQDKNVLCDLSKPHAPIHIVGGWYDFFCKQSFDDYNRAREAGSKYCRLTVGKWKHWDLGFVWPSLNIALDLFNSSENADVQPLSTDICVEFLGTHPSKWGSFSEWPPAASELTPFTLMDMQKESERAFSEYHWNPLQPTPYVGGPSFCPVNSGKLDQSALEGRADVLNFTGNTLEEDIYICGDVYIDLTVESTNAHTDFFVKLCDVDKSGNCFNIVENLIRLEPNDWSCQKEDGDVISYFVEKKRVKIGPIANCFNKGHRVRVLIAGGAHPLYNRNNGTGDHFATCTEMKAAHHKVFHETTLLFPCISENDIKDARF